MAPCQSETAVRTFTCDCRYPLCLSDRSCPRTHLRRCLCLLSGLLPSEKGGILIPCVHRSGCRNPVRHLGIREKIQISESLLSHAVLDYFTDISRLKHFHQAKHINSLKVISYETYWLLRRKPIQILVEDETSDAMAFLNEKFVFSRIAKYLMGDGKRVILSPETKKGFLNYLDSLFYYLKYRNYDAEMLEMMLMGFKAGVLVADDLKEQES